MSAVLLPVWPRRKSRAMCPAVFDGRLARCGDDELLNHFRDRAQVPYFPVLNPVYAVRENVDPILDACFRFDGRTVQFKGSPDWSGHGDRNSRWHHQLHAFEYSVGLGVAYHETYDSAYQQTWVSLVDSWIDAALGPVYPDTASAATRLRSWVYGYSYFVINNRWQPITARFHRRLLDSLHAQCVELHHDLNSSRACAGVPELYSLFLASLVFPEFTAASRWREFATAALHACIVDDLLADGVHRRCSSEHHHRLLKFCLDYRRLAALNHCQVPEGVDRRLRRALDFCAYAHKPDGSSPAFGDSERRSDLRLLLQGYELFGDERWLYIGTQGQHGRAPRERFTSFDHAGYHFLRSGWGEHGDYSNERYLAFRCGPAGTGKPVHFDQLSVELAAYGASLVVDPGRCAVADDAPLQWIRESAGTACHNTVQIDGLEQSDSTEPGAAHIAGKGGPVHHLHRRICREAFQYLHGSLRSLNYPVIHHRHVVIVRNRYWLVIDQLQSGSTHRYDLRYHLSAQAEGRVQVARRPGACVVDSPQLLVVNCAAQGDGFDVEPGYVSHGDQSRHRAPVLRFSRYADTTWFATLLYPWNDYRPQVAMERLPITRDGGPDHSACAVQIESIHEGETRFDLCLVSSEPENHEREVGSVRMRASHAMLSRAGNGALRDLELADGGAAWENGSALHVDFDPS